MIAKALVLLDGAPFKAFSERREDWKCQDYYRCPGPLQFSTGDMDIPLTLKYELMPAGGTDRTLMSLPAQPSCSASLSPLKRRSKATSTVRLLISVCLPWRRNAFPTPRVRLPVCEAR